MGGEFGAHRFAENEAAKRKPHSDGYLQEHKGVIENALAIKIKLLLFLLVGFGFENADRLDLVALPQFHHHIFALHDFPKNAVA